jgi:quercetin 2,3-dioxygenase
MNQPSLRELAAVIPSVPASDGAGVKLRRSLGSRQDLRVDPYLMLDEFFSDDPNDYLAGFPAHPHRGFETITYMLDGHMRHEDSHGNRGDLGPGDAQWMTAAHGIIHSEMPQQTAGRMRGFQIWLNLPAAEKMKPASYRDIAAAQIPTLAVEAGSVRVIAGEFVQGAARTAGPIGGVSTQPLFLDLRLQPHATLDVPVDAAHNAFAYVYEGEVSVGAQRRTLPFRAAGILGAGGVARFEAGPNGASLLLLAGRPLHEPVVQYGPFVMNSREQIEAAIRDYQSGQLGAQRAIAG